VLSKSLVPRLQFPCAFCSLIYSPQCDGTHGCDVGIVRVDVSIDGGKTWTDATLTEGSEQPKDRAWAWTFWECDIEIPKDASTDTISIISKATDVSYNVQPDTVEGIWNLRGINNNAWHRVPLKVLKEDDV